jgi:hypothetical protein
MEHVDPRQPSTPQPLDQDRLSCSWERPSAIAREVTPLTNRWADELGVARFEPDWDRVFALERAGALAVWTARTLDRTLVGYAVCSWTRGFWTNQSFCRIDPFYLTPEWRGPHGWRYMKSLVAAIARLTPGCELEWETNDAFQPDEHGRSRLAKLLERLSFRQVGTTFQRRA